MADELILKTGKLYEFEMLAAALTENGVPYYRREEQFSGAQFATPAFPMQGPGIFYAIYTPTKCAEDARKVLAGLTIEAEINSGMWSYNPKPWARRVMIALAAFFLLIGAASVIVDFF